VARIFAIVLALVLVGPSLAATARPTVTVPSTKPFAVSGAHFKPGEHVRVVVYARTTAAKTVTAAARGTFFVRFPALSVGQSCERYAVRATGDRGSTAALKVTPECPPPAP